MMLAEDIPDTKKAYMWAQIDWEATERKLADMQRSIALAVRHVCGSGAMAGIDDVKWTTAAEKMTAAL